MFLIYLVDSEAIGGPYEYGDHIEYEYFPPSVEELTKDPKGLIYTLRKNGDWCRKGQKMGEGGTVVLGYMERYWDPSF